MNTEEQYDVTIDYIKEIIDIPSKYTDEYKYFIGISGVQKYCLGIDLAARQLNTSIYEVGINHKPWFEMYSIINVYSHDHLYFNINDKQAYDCSRDKIVDCMQWMKLICACSGPKFNDNKPVFFDPINKLIKVNDELFPINKFAILFNYPDSNNYKVVGLDKYLEIRQSFYKH